MKVMHKPTLLRHRGCKYDANGEVEMITNLDKVDNEILIWRSLMNDNIIRLYEIIDDLDHDYIYLISELGDMGTIMNYNEERNFVRN